MITRTLRGVLRASLGARMPITSGELRVDGPKSSITIRRDAYGVPYIDAGNDDDAAFAMGFCQAQDRGFQLELFVRVARGTLAELLGEEMLDVDRLMRRIGFVGIARRQFEQLAPPVRAMLAAFARGVTSGQSWGSSRVPPELALLRAAPTPFEPTDTLAILQFMAFALSSNWDAELARLRILRADGVEALLALEPCVPKWDNEAQRLLRLDAAVLGAAERLADHASELAKISGVRGASNAFAVAPSRTRTGRPLLAGDPHLSPSLPAPWYLTHVRTPEWSLSGACFPGQPTVSIGHNGHVAWSITAGHVDNTDLFVERLSPDGESYFDGDRFVRGELRTEIIRVRGRAPVEEKVLVTPRGPIVSPPLGGDLALSMRGTWMAARPVGGYQLRSAKTVREALGMLASYPAISENRVFADVEGTIARKIVGDAPKRRRGRGILPVPGWDNPEPWDAEPLPAAALPESIDPAEGFVVVANQPPGPSPTGEFLGVDFLDPSRHDRLHERLAARTDWDLDTAMELQTDRATRVWPRVRDVVLAVARAIDDRDAVELLEAWDGVVSAESPAAAIFELFFANALVRAVRAKAPSSWRAAVGEGTNVLLPHGMMALRRIEHFVELLREQPAGWFRGAFADELGAALRDAMRTLRARGGRETWGWGAVRPVFLVHPVGSKAPLDRVWSRGPLPFGGDATTVAQASVVFDRPTENAIGIPNLRIALDVGNWDRSRFVLAGGQSGNPFSPNYDDMLPRWLAGDAIEMAFTEGAIRARTKVTLRLRPR